MRPDPNVIREWRGAAPYWEKHQAAIRQLFAPVTQALMADAGVASGHNVLDVATGPGEPALSIADAIGPAGRVTGVDPISEMVAAARRATVLRGLGNVQFEVAFADQLPYPDQSFDAAVCRFGMMFCPSPTDAVREMLRVLKQGGRLALAVWHFAEANPFLSTLPEIMGRYVESPPSSPDAPDTFCFANPGKLLDLVAKAGATGVSERLLRFTINVSGGFEDFWTLRSEISEKMRAKLAILSPGQVAAVKAEALEAHSRYDAGGGMRFPAEVLIVSGAKP